MTDSIDPTLRTDDFDYDIPSELIAQEPLPERDSSRLLVLDRATGGITHASFQDFPTLLERGDLVVANNTKVMNARLFAARKGTGGKVELLILEHLENGRWSSLAKPSRRLKAGDTLVIGGDDLRNPIEIIIANNLGDGIVELESDPDVDLGALAHGHVPLPPYITTKLDSPARYQTVFATTPGSAAAPTAGLHVTEQTLLDLQARDVGWAEVTLHIGLDTFRPVSEELVRDHHIHTEWCSVADPVARSIADTLQSQRKIIALGTTAARTLETAGRRWQMSEPGGFETDTSIFITPGYDWTITGALLTNFHLPRSTLLMMVMSFAGRDFVERAYQTAIERKYRFYSFGDAMLIL